MYPKTIDNTVVKSLKHKWINNLPFILYFGEVALFGSGEVAAPKALGEPY